MKRAIRAIKEEMESIGFAAGGGLIITGVAMVSIPAAFILGGLMVCGATLAIALGRRAQKRRRQS